MWGPMSKKRENVGQSYRQHHGETRVFTQVHAKKVPLYLSSGRSSRHLSCFNACSLYRCSQNRLILFPISLRYFCDTAPCAVERFKVVKRSRLACISLRGLNTSEITNCLRRLALHMSVAKPAKAGVESPVALFLLGQARAAVSETTQILHA
ncbi:hypothetical protein IE81DRAFT_95982 [Ceraceosorus guamensis]|uniref:Uncharacterized protein n=1 Tax=Ceraceosorus guamensis TaxID=1522189 RepID=A0A316W3Y3_9BASI|nr:hypothetical protein IE81DRAFT_95982 [Ceraceosorus guamensis]PWN43331.1 hypothetical protein IE81DRAFT_95982 [Ceraceosorus guamensis]